MDWRRGQAIVTGVIGRSLDSIHDPFTGQPQDSHESHLVARAGPMQRAEDRKSNGEMSLSVSVARGDNG